MELVMCRSCGEFVHAFPEDGTYVPRRDECPACGGTGFKHIGTGSVIDTDD